MKNIIVNGGNISGKGKGFPNCHVTAFTLCDVHTNINLLADLMKYLNVMSNGLDINCL